MANQVEALLERVPLDAEEVIVLGRHRNGKLYTDATLSEPTQIRRLMQSCQEALLASESALAGDDGPLY